MADDVLTRNSDEELALRVIQSSGDTGMNKDDVYTRDSQGRLAVRTVGGSGGGGGSGLPDQTDNAGKFLTTDGTTASWGEALVNRATGPYALAVGEYAQATDIYSTAFGPNSVARGVWTTALGYGSKASAQGSTAVGYKAYAEAEGAIQLGRKGTNSDANTFKVANENGNFEMMDANGNVPLDRLTYVTDQIGDISTALTSILGE